MDYLVNEVTIVSLIEAEETSRMIVVQLLNWIPIQGARLLVLEPLVETSVVEEVLAALDDNYLILGLVCFKADSAVCIISGNA